MSFGAFIQAKCVGVVEKLLFNCRVTSCTCRGAVLDVFSLPIMERFSLKILPLFDHMDANSVLAFDAIAPLCEIDWSALGEQNLIHHK